MSQVTVGAENGNRVEIFYGNYDSMQTAGGLWSEDMTKRMWHS
jgi:hypothetical protein